jgi:hypothetical protein
MTPKMLERIGFPWTRVGVIESQLLLENHVPVASITVMSSQQRTRALG